jgi:hypothetical protein
MSLRPERRRRDGSGISAGRRRFAKKRQGPNVEELVMLDLDAIAAGRTFAWIHLCHLLSMTEEDDCHLMVPLDHDLNRLPRLETRDA